MKLSNYLQGAWVNGAGEGRPLVNPVTGDVIAHASAEGVDIASGLTFARVQGGPSLAAMRFDERGAALKAVARVLQANRDAYGELARLNSGNTASDAAVDIDGGIGTLKYYARLGTGLGDGVRIVEEDRDQLARDPVFFAQHIWSSRPGVAVQINAFNFPSWGMWEKFATSFLAGVPSVVKPATATALLTHQMVRDVIESGVLPEGSLSLVCGAGDGLLHRLGPMDSLAFTGSAETGDYIRGHKAVLRSGARIAIEADSVNASILGPDVAPDTDLFDLALREMGKAVQVKAGQLCTNIRRVLVPRALLDQVTEALAARLAGLVVGDPAEEATQVGPLINQAQRRDAEEKIAVLLTDCREVARTPLGDVREASGFVAPRVLVCDDPEAAREVHCTEVFGPCLTLMPYDDIGQAARLANTTGGALAVSLFSDDAEVQAKVAAALLPWHGRLLCVDSAVGRSHTGHSMVMPQCVHGGPGRAGGGEELGGLRGLRFHMQRSAVQGSPTLLDALAETASLARL